MDSVIVETMTLNEEESLAAEVKILDSMSEDNIPDDVLRSKVRGNHAFFWCVTRGGADSHRLATHSAIRRTRLPGARGKA